MLNPTIGRVLITQRERATPFRFYAWVTDPSLEVAQFLIAENDDGTDKMLVMVESVEHTSSVKSHIEAFFGHSYGNPVEQPASRAPVIRIIGLMVLARTIDSFSPPGDSYSIKRPTDEDLVLLSRDIPKERRVIGGLLKISIEKKDQKSWTPIYFDSNLLLGPESGHLNISGVSGMATKSSYAVFLTYSLLEWAKKNNEEIAIVVFNVKAQDFLQIHKIPSSKQNLPRLFEEWGKTNASLDTGAQSLAMWRTLFENGINPLETRPDIKYFTYESDPDANILDSPEYYSYGLQNVSYGDLLSSLFSRDEVNSPPQEQLIQDYLDSHNNASFNGFLNHLSEATRHEGQNRRRVGSGTGTFTTATIRVLLNRIRSLLSRSNNIIERAQPNGLPIKPEDLIPGINVIQLNRLTDEEMRLVGNAVIRELFTNLESQSRLFSRVIVFFDELNKFAPRRAISPVKRQIVDIVARGRALNFTLIGAEQFATQIDDEVFGNSVTKLVGYSEYSEIRNPIYKPLGDLRELVPYLKKGQMVVRHPTYPSPMILYFPVPLHLVFSDE